MMSIGLKTGGRALWGAAFLISLKTGDVLELTISPAKAGRSSLHPAGGLKQQAARFKSKTARLLSLPFAGVPWRSLAAAGWACPDRLALLTVTALALLQRYGSVTA